MSSIPPSDRYSAKPDDEGIDDANEQVNPAEAQAARIAREIADERRDAADGEVGEADDGRSGETGPE